MSNNENRDSQQENGTTGNKGNNNNVTEFTGIKRTYRGKSLPQPYVIKDKTLYKETIKNVDGIQYPKYEHISTTIPIVDKRYTDVETGEVSYNLFFISDGIEVIKSVEASTISKKAELIEMARFGLDVYDTNANDVLKFMRWYMRDNRPTKNKVATRLGHVNNYFVHPLSTDGIELKVDSGYKKIVKSFQTIGTIESYKNGVFNLVKDSPMQMIMIYASLGSILLYDLGIEPFAIDLSGHTSTGKTTALKVSASVWGKYWGDDCLISEWNTTSVYAERKASFLNSFPLFLDDTTKQPDADILQNIIYNHSSGHTKGRAKKKANQVEDTKSYNNILISTGETSLSDYSGKKGGMAARIITLQDEPYINGIDFQTIYKRIENNHGTIGVEFINQYESNKEYYKQQFEVYATELINQCKNNNVLSRVARSFALLKVSANILSDIKGYEHDYDNHISTAFSSVRNNNKNLDKPKQQLIQVLEMLQANPSSIDGATSIIDRPNHIKAIYKDEHLGILSQTLTDMFGVESTNIIKQWYKRGWLDTGKTGYQKLIRGTESRKNCYAIKTKIINELGFDFSNTDDNHINENAIEVNDLF